MSETRVVVPVDEQRVREIIREELIEARIRELDPPLSKVESIRLALRAGVRLDA